MRREQVVEESGMINLNKLGLDASRIKFIEGDSANISLESGTVDIVTCSQSLHWYNFFS